MTTIIQDTKTIGDFFGDENNKCRFFIPSYQRGYRWEEKQIKELLNDIYDFVEKHEESDDSVYYLQPVVVMRKGDNSYYLLDGQQRLTTIYLILRTLDYLYSNYDTNVLFKNKNLNYGILEEIKNYNSNSFYEIIFDEERGELEWKNIVDYAYKYESLNDTEKNNIYEYIYSDINGAYAFEAVKTICEWIEERSKNKDNERTFTKFIRAICDDSNETRPLVKVIWQEDDESKTPEEAIEKFLTLNTGKIQLTSSEIIKAMFMQAIKRSDQNNQEAEEADFLFKLNTIDRKLQEDQFWYFLSNDAEKQARMDLLFELMTAEEEKTDKLPKPEDVISHFEEKLLVEKTDPEKTDPEKTDPEKTDPEKTDWREYWKKVYDLYDRLIFFYEEPELYNLIGFLISQDSNDVNIKTVLGIFKEAKTSNNGDYLKTFKEGLRKQIGNLKIKSSNTIKDLVDKNEIKRLSYVNNGQEIETLLLLFNIETHNKLKSKFPFDRYYKQSFDLEHVGSQKTKELKDITADEITENLKTTDSLLDLVKRLAEAKEIDTTSDLDELKKDSDYNKYEKLKERAKKDEKKYYKKDKEIYIEISKKIDEKIVQKVIPYEEVKNKHSISNLALLDHKTNIEYHNSYFFYKQYYVLKRAELEKDRYIPICTRNLFLKYYSVINDTKEIDQLNWTDNDCMGYLDEIVRTLSAYK